MKKTRAYYEGYLTVEATFVVPVAFMIVVLLLYWGFYCYDKSVSVQCSYLSVLRGSGEWNLTNQELEEYVNRQLQSLTDETILYCKTEEMSASVDLFSIKADISAKMDILFSKLRGDDMTRWEWSSEKSAYRMKPSSFIRKYHFSRED